jgi:hypothetical protein
MDEPIEPQNPEYCIDRPYIARVEMQFGCNTLSNGFDKSLQDWDVTPISTSTTHRTRTLKDTNTVLDRRYKLCATPLGSLPGIHVTHA